METLGTWGLLSHKPTDPADNFACPIAVPDDESEIVADLVEVRRLCGPPTQTRARIRNNTRKPLVDLMRDQGCHLADEHDPIDAREICLGLLQSFLRVLALRHVVVCLEDRR